MAYTGVATKAVAMCSMLFAGVSGVEAVKSFIAKPLIEGSGIYNKAVRAGETVPIRWLITKRTDCLGWLSRVWVGENGYYLLEASSPSGLPASNLAVEYNIETTIPSTAPPGSLALSIKGEYR